MHGSNYEVSRASLGFVAQQAKHGMLSGLGISKVDFDKLTGDSPWIPAERTRIGQLLQQLAWGSSDAMGLPRHELPAEVWAAVIALYIAPINVYPAVYIISSLSLSSVNDSVFNNDDRREMPKLSARQMVALVCSLQEDVCYSPALTLLQRRSALAISRATVAKQLAEITSESSN